jgi:antitoxin (DNA-binding transcriptional repressor) of toxin-antitoxin stability system
MKRAPIAEVDAHLVDYLDQAAVEPVIITRDGRPIAALVAVDGEEDLERFTQVRPPRLQRLLEDAYQRIKRGEGMSEDEFWKAVERDAAAKVSQPPG